MLCINTYIEATHEKKQQQRKEIEKVRNNEDKESFITNIETYIQEREKKTLVFIHLVVYDCLQEFVTYLIAPQQFRSAIAMYGDFEKATTREKNFRHLSRHPESFRRDW